MTEQPESSTTSNSPQWRGITYAVFAGALAAALLFLPVLLLGYTIQIVASVATGEVLAWQSSVGLNYAILGPIALLSVTLLIIPFLRYRAATRIIGRTRATLWAGGVLAAALAGVALFWLIQAQLRSSAASQPEYWYALAFALAAVVVLLASVLMARGTAVAAIAVLGAAAAGILVLAGSLVAVWGSGPRIPANAQTVDIISTPYGLELQPDSVQAGTVYVYVDGASDSSGHGEEVSFVSAGYASDDRDLQSPLTESGIRTLRLGDYGATSIEASLPGVSRYELREGFYAFVVFGPEGDVPRVAPQSVAVLEVRP